TDSGIPGPAAQGDVAGVHHRFHRADERGGGREQRDVPTAHGLRHRGGPVLRHVLAAVAVERAPGATARACRRAYGRAPVLRTLVFAFRSTAPGRRAGSPGRGAVGRGTRPLHPITDPARRWSPVPAGQRTRAAWFPTTPGVPARWPGSPAARAR